MTILVISLLERENKLHHLEYVRPITNILERENKKYEIKNYLDVREAEDYEKVIICGTSLKENSYLDNFEKLKWITDYNKPILGICAGAQVIAKIFRAKIEKKSEIGLHKMQILKEDPIVKNLKSNEIYSLHSLSFEVPLGFEVIARTQIPQIIRKNNIYCIIFHPEARNENIIVNFIN